MRQDEKTITDGCFVLMESSNFLVKRLNKCLIKVILFGDYIMCTSLLPELQTVADDSFNYLIQVKGPLYIVVQETRCTLMETQ